ncbi:hypothetical protein KFK09_023186 [Dendrobium nobile]|uniref:Uncharacterized protein n=1 Tax=Dendrobium nobile TaxID=94219 RepID=A0A8T3AM22_DENNO|nr:hypothetical protein KFK09_023186 [Dendrobium nobile]
MREPWRGSIEVPNSPLCESSWFLLSSTTSSLLPLPPAPTNRPPTDSPATAPHSPATTGLLFSPPSPP